VEKYGDAWVQPGKFVGNGPFKLVAWRLGDRVTVEKNPRFWDAAKVCADRINYYPTQDAIGAERRIQRGELDLNTSFQSNRIERLRQPGQLPDHVRTHVSLATAYVSFNTRDVKAFQDVRVRRALSESIDRDFITVKLLRAGQVPAYAFVPPGTANAKPGARTVWAGKPFTQRQAEARRLLAAAGYGPGNPLRFEIKTSTSTDTQILVQAIQADWKAIGVEAKLIQNEGQIAFEAYRTRDFDVGAMSWYADFNDPVTFLDLLRSNTGAQNYGDYKNPAYDALLDAATLEPDAVKRAGILSRAEQTLLNDEAIAPLYFVVNRNLVSPRITGFIDNQANFHRSRWLCLK
jgi:oligopeptide transport system substrate-binding protein